MDLARPQRVVACARGRAIPVDHPDWYPASGAAMTGRRARHRAGRKGNGMDDEPRTSSNSARSSGNARQALWAIGLACEAAVTRLESITEQLELNATRLPMDGLEHAALAERVETVAAELRWLQEKAAQLNERARHEAAEDQAGHAGAATAVHQPGTDCRCGRRYGQRQYRPGGGPC